MTDDNNCTIGHTSSTAQEIDSQTNTAQMLSTGLLEIYAPPLNKVKNSLRELISKQNKVYIDICTEKYKFETNSMVELDSMINQTKSYKAKLLKIKQQMQSIHQRSKVLKKRAIQVQALKEKENSYKLFSQQQEESLIKKDCTTSKNYTTQDS